jgi:ribose 5-phosphate isomerase B
MRVGIASDHGGFQLKRELIGALRAAGLRVRDFGTYVHSAAGDYPDYVTPLAKAVAHGEVERGIAICDSGVGACLVANKIPGVRAALVHEGFSARNGVEQAAMNVMCLGGRVTGPAAARELVESFLAARFSDNERTPRRLDKVTALETQSSVSIPKNPSMRLQTFGQSVWLDSMWRDMLARGWLESFIENDGLQGATTSVSIFEKAIASSRLYEEAILKLVFLAKNAEDLYLSLAIEDKESRGPDA